MNILGLGHSENEATLAPASDGPDLVYHKCMAIARNMWWSWHPEVVHLFRDIDPVRWRELDHNPIALLREFTPETLAYRAGERVLHSRINYAYRRLGEYINSSSTWAHTHAGVLGSKPVAYFSAEFGLHESLPIYSGGLGVLSGDHIKSASGLGIPLVGIGLFYNHGYFKQRLSADGYQSEEYIEHNIENLPLTPARTASGSPFIVTLDTRPGELHAKVWKLAVGRVTLFLLDSNFEGNRPEDRELTSRLYGGDERTRIRQELLIGVGGIRTLQAMGITPGAYHLNEGHSAFATLEAMRFKMVEDGLSIEDAQREIANATLFTTHTPVPAGHDRFNPDLIEEHLGPLRDGLGISHEHLMSLGRVNTADQREPFCMTVLGLKLSRRANAVSQLHGHVSRRMWRPLWPNREETAIPIGHITNGVHVQSWLAEQMLQLYDRHFPAHWTTHMGEPGVWQSIHQVDPGELWETHNALKNMLLAFVRRRLARQMGQRHEAQENIDLAMRIGNPSALTIGFARRFATYKRANLIFSDIDRIAAIVNDTTRPVQILFAGKAHPKDEPGKRFIQEIANFRGDSRFAGKVIFIEDYDINVCRHMIQGVDVWLNNPRRPLEASGTSGQKVILNGGLNLSILDGWWAEAYDGTNGFAIGKGTSHADDRITDSRDASNLYEALEKQVIPMFFNRDQDGLPAAWIQHMRNSISTLAWRFSSHRMVMDYARMGYVPASGGLSSSMP